MFELCVSELCVFELCVFELCVSELCVFECLHGQHYLALFIEHVRPYLIENVCVGVCWCVHTGAVPALEENGPSVSNELEWMNLHAHCR